jgi:hypothetical protein
MKHFVIVMVIFLLLGCSNKYHGIKKICDGKFQVEFYSEWNDMGVCYLTDSTNFRIKIERYNIESEYFEYNCNPDSLIISLWSNYPLPKHILKTKTFNVKKLIEDGKFDN